MSSPRVTVLLPTHNRSDTLRLSLASVLGQTVDDLEVLVVGDGCTDDSARVVASFGDPRVRWFDLPKAAGFGYANRNVALGEARGELVAFAAHDDLWFPDHLATLIPAFDDPAVVLAYTMPLWIDPEGLVTPMPVNLGDDELRREFLERRRNVLPAGNVVHRRSCFDRVGYWDPGRNGAGDWDLWSRIIEAHGGRSALAYVPLPTQAHFRASWRRNPVLEPAEVRASWRARARFPVWDRALRVPTAGHATEQAAVARAMAEGGAAWVAGLRRDVAGLLDRRGLEFDGLATHRDPDAETLGRLLAAEATLYGAGFRLPSGVPAVTATGLRRAGAFFFLAPSASLTVEPGETASTVVLGLACLRAKEYADFPLDLTVEGPAGFHRHVRFRRDAQSVRLRLPLGAEGASFALACSSALVADPGRSLVLTGLQAGPPASWSLLSFLWRSLRRLSGAVAS